MIRDSLKNYFDQRIWPLQKKKLLVKIRTSPPHPDDYWSTPKNVVHKIVKKLTTYFTTQNTNYDKRNVPALFPLLIQ